MSSPVEEIKSKIDIVDLISEYLQLRPAGVNFKGLCPFHREKTPSFFVSPERQIWHCFGCGVGGDIFGFVMKMENAEFPEALRILARKAGVEIVKQDYHLMSQRTKLLDITKMAAKFYHLILLDSPLAEKARQYLQDRGLKTETIKEFQLGFAPDRWDELYKFLSKKGFKTQEMEAAGLVSKSNNYFDRFRHRIIFPINDLYGNPIGFTSRIVPWAETKETAKYVNTPETLIYSKGRVLYGLDKAKLAIKEAQAAILVEGNMDVLACHQAGSKNVVASSGTALTLEQVKLLKRYTNNLLLAFDVDLAGETATQRGIDLSLKEEMNLKIIQVAEGKDPDECIKDDPKKWFEAVAKAQPMMEYYFDLALKNRDPQKIEDKKEVVKILLPVIAKLGDSVEQNHWLKILAAKIDVEEYSLRDKISRLGGMKTVKVFTNRETAETIKPSKSKIVGERFLGFLFRYPEIVLSDFQKMPLECFTAVQLRHLAQTVKDWYDANRSFSDHSFRDSLKEEAMTNYFDYLGLLIEKEFAAFPPQLSQFKERQKKDLVGEIKSLAKILKEDCLKKQRTELTAAIKAAEKAKDQDKLKELLGELININQEIHQL